MILKGLIFDLDGVVIDSEHHRDKVTDKLVKSLGFSYDRDRIKPLMSGKSSVGCMQVLVDEYGLSMSAEQLDAQRRGEIQAIYRDVIPFVPGFLDFYQQLLAKFDVPVAVATGCDPDYFELVDKRLGITELFGRHIYHSDIIGQPKPAPDVFIHTAKQIGVDCSECRIFEDAPNGIAAGLRANSQVVALTRTFSRDILMESTARILGYQPESQRLLFIDSYEQDSLDTVIKFVES